MIKNAQTELPSQKFVHKKEALSILFFGLGSDTGIRTRVSAVRGRRPGPLDDIANEANQQLARSYKTPTLACVSFVLLDSLGEKASIFLVASARSVSSTML